MSVRDELTAVVNSVLAGIDREEINDSGPDGAGWWETSFGAEFGARKRDELIDAILARFNVTPKPVHSHSWQDITSVEQWEAGVGRFWYCGGLDGCGENIYADSEPA